MAKLAGKDETVVESLDASLEILQPEQNSIEVDGEIIVIKPFTFGKLLKALKYLSNLADLFSGGGELQETLLQGFAKHGDDVIGLLSLATNKPREFFDELSADKGLDMAVIAYKVNESFFTTSLFPKLNELLPSDSQNEETEIAVSPPVEQKSKKTGSTSSKS